MLKITVFTALLVVPTITFGAGATESACLRSDRSPGREACACAQSVADQTLSRGDQKIAARIIKDPDHFYKYYGSKNPRNQAFLERYRAWGTAAHEFCRPNS